MDSRQAFPMEAKMTTVAVQKTKVGLIVSVVMSILLAAITILLFQNCSKTNLDILPFTDEPSPTQQMNSVNVTNNAALIPENDVGQTSESAPTQAPERRNCFEGAVDYEASGNICTASFPAFSHGTEVVANDTNLPVVGSASVVCNDGIVSVIGTKAKRCSQFSPPQQVAPQPTPNIQQTDQSIPATGQQGAQQTQQQDAPLQPPTTIAPVTPQAANCENVVITYTVGGVTCTARSETLAGANTVYTIYDDQTPSQGSINVICSNGNVTPARDGIVNYRIEGTGPNTVYIYNSAGGNYLANCQN